jgi:8-oxo-dGTP diphosphatase
MVSDIPVFGVRNASQPQKTRACAYVVVANSEGLVAAVRENSGKVLLPGGGIDPTETAAEAIHREVREELGCTVRLGRCLGHALQFLENDGHNQATYAAFYEGHLGEQCHTSHEFELQWVQPQELSLAHQMWVAKALLNTRSTIGSHQ